ncbi:MAG TPA: flagellar biosynthetic protein FliO [Mizugakiibacter sp.]|nr:flagellar biosynthetic protein FliO [Mizugakiibacter sp.]
MNTGAAAMNPWAYCRQCLGWWGLLGLLPIPVVAAGLPATTTPANIALPDLTGETVHMLGVLGLVLGTIYALSWMLKRAHGRGRPGSHALRSVAALSVGARERVVLIQVGERQMLIGVAPGNVRLLRVLDDPIETVTLKTPPAFSEALQRMLRRGAGR